MLETAKRLGIDDAITVPLKGGPDVTGLDRIESSFGLAAETCLGAQDQTFALLNLFPDSYGFIQPFEL
jgi:hypothetical protein